MLTRWRHTLWNFIEMMKHRLQFLEHENENEFACTFSSDWQHFEDECRQSEPHEFIFTSSSFSIIQLICRWARWRLMIGISLLFTSMHHHIWQSVTHIKFVAINSRCNSSHCYDANRSHSISNFISRRYDRMEYSEDNGPIRSSKLIELSLTNARCVCPVLILNNGFCDQFQMRKKTILCVV